VDYNVTGEIWTEIKDQANNFSNGTFTAPSSGDYILCGVIYLKGIDSTNTYGIIYLKTSNRNYLINTANLYALSGSGDVSVPFSFLCDMDANDTAYLNIVINGNKTVDISANMYFSGYEMP
jgi:hypothetical protein